MKVKMFWLLPCFLALTSFSAEQRRNHETRVLLGGLKWTIGAGSFCLNAIDASAMYEGDASRPDVRTATVLALLGGVGYLLRKSAAVFDRECAVDLDGDPALRILRIQNSLALQLMRDAGVMVMCFAGSHTLQHEVSYYMGPAAPVVRLSGIVLGMGVPAYYCWQGSKNYWPRAKKGLTSFWESYRNCWGG